MTLNHEYDRETGRCVHCNVPESMASRGEPCPFRVKCVTAKARQLGFTETHHQQLQQLMASYLIPADKTSGK